MKVLIIKANPKTNEVETSWLEGSNLLARAAAIKEGCENSPIWEGWKINYIPVVESDVLSTF
jgi:hypothetical protein